MSETPIHGVCDSEFEEVRNAFAVNFRDHGEVGARVSVIRDGETVVDLWGGYRTPDKTEPWADDTLVCCMSVTKGIVALAAHMLHGRGALNYDEPVATYWPEFARAGKEGITVRQALAHQASLAVIESAEPGDALNWPVFTAKIAAQTPNWEPGTQETYHSVTFGYIIGEIVRRIDGRPIAQFIEEELAKPLGADYILGCSQNDLERVVAHIPNPNNELMSGGLLNENTLAQFAPMPADPNFFGSRQFLEFGFPSGGGVAHAHALARLFAPLALGGSYNGVDPFDERTLSLMAEEQWYKDDFMFGNDFRVALGLLLDTRFNYWGRDGNIGTAGAGGFCAFADPQNRFSFGYTPNRYTSGYGLGEEPKRLIDAVYGCL